MSEKRFNTNGYYINDTFSDGRKWLVNEVEAKEIVDVMNNLDMKARERSKALSKLQKKVNEQQATITHLDKVFGKNFAKRRLLERDNLVLRNENEQLRFLIDINSVSERKKLERQVDEQQATINELKAQLREKEEDEKLYANEILELREANKEFIQFKELGGDY